jgi:hypothetical protein
MESQTFTQWLDTFLDEKKLPNKQFNIDYAGDLHFFNSEQIIDLVRKSSPREQSQFKSIIVKIDFLNGDVNHFLEHLAKGYIACHY